MKRYQDIDELLKAGIDIYTTLDIQHIESIQDTVSAVMGHAESERIPDSVFDQAARVEFVDIEPETLQARLLQQKKTELLSAYSLSQLSALRGIGLRRCADRAALYTSGTSSRAGYRTHEHILACLSSAPSNAKIIRTARPDGRSLPVRLYGTVCGDRNLPADDIAGQGTPGAPTSIWPRAGGHY